MVLTVIPMALNVAIGVALWMSKLSLLPKILITIVFAAKFALYLYAALMAESERVTSIGLVTCTFVNVVFSVYFALASVWCAIPGCAILAILALVWGRKTGFSFKKED